MTDEANPKDIQGAKKPPISLVPPSVIIHLAMAFKEGAEKYGAYNWRSKKVQTLIYCDAIMRHLLAYIDGEDIDQESGKHHLAGVLASAAVLLDAQENDSLIDNRPPKGNASELIKKYSGSRKLGNEELYNTALEVETEGSTFKPWEEEFYSDNGGYNCPCGCRGVEE